MFSSSSLHRYHDSADRSTSHRRAVERCQNMSICTAFLLGAQGSLAGFAVSVTSFAFCACPVLYPIPSFRYSNSNPSHPSDSQNHIDMILPGPRTYSLTRTCMKQHTVVASTQHNSRTRTPCHRTSHLLRACFPFHSSLKHLTTRNDKNYPLTSRINSEKI